MLFKRRSFFSPVRFISNTPPSNPGIQPDLGVITAAATGMVKEWLSVERAGEPGSANDE
jgi:hypothetical protein